MTSEDELADLLAGWNPGSVEQAGQITAEPASTLAGLLDCPSPVARQGDPLPPLWQWVYFLDRPPQRDLGPDGHLATGPFMPPLPHRRRMFAGGRMDCRAPIRAGDEITRRGDMSGWTVKHGRTGALLFVTLRYSFTRGSTVLAVEEQDLVYRSDPPGGTGEGVAGEGAAGHSPAPPVPPGAADRAHPADPPAGWRLDLCPDPVLLFRFSALTYNAHRIHYDAPYATSVEGHPGLVVHGPLLALLCLELPRRHAPDRAISRLSFRARRPLYSGQWLTVSGGTAEGGAEMQAAAGDGTRAMTATATFAP